MTHLFSSISKNYLIAFGFVISLLMTPVSPASTAIPAELRIIDINQQGRATHIAFGVSGSNIKVSKKFLHSPSRVVFDLPGVRPSMKLKLPHLPSSSPYRKIRIGRHIGFTRVVLDAEPGRLLNPENVHVSVNTFTHATRPHRIDPARTMHHLHHSKTRFSPAVPQISIQRTNQMMAYCRQNANVLIALPRHELLARHLGEECLSYLDERMAGGKHVPLHDQQVIIADTRPEPVIDLNTSQQQPAPISDSFDTEPQLSPYMLSVAMGLNKQFAINNNVNINHNAISFHEKTRFGYGKQFVLSLIRDMDYGGANNTALGLTYVYASSPVKEMIFNDGSSKVADHNNGSKTDLHAFMLDYYWHTDPQETFEFLAGLGVGAGYFETDMPFTVNGIAQPVIFRDQSLSFILQPVLAVRYRVNPLWQLSLSYRLLAAPIPRSTDILVEGTKRATLKSRYINNLINIGLTYRFTTSPDTP